jgi:hypothetical protein
MSRCGGLPPIRPVEAGAGRGRHAGRHGTMTDWAIAESPESIKQLICCPICGVRRTRSCSPGRMTSTSVPCAAPNRSRVRHGGLRAVIVDVRQRRERSGLVESSARPIRAARQCAPSSMRLSVESRGASREDSTSRRAATGSVCRPSIKLGSASRLHAHHPSALRYPVRGGGPHEI